MTAFSLYLSSPKTKAVLSRKPGDAGFSLIELVVVVAVLAILAAIAIPAFTSINDNAAQAAAKNTIAQIAKECAVKKANGEDLEFNVPSLNSYDIEPDDGDCDADEFEATLKNDASEELPGVIGYKNKTGGGTAAGTKYCTAGDNENFCEGGRW